MNKPLDKTKKSNRKCEHCQSFETKTDNKRDDGTCHIVKKVLVGEVDLQRPRRYWHTCDDFEWRRGL